MYVPDSERRDKDLDDVDHDAIAHRLRQDVVSTVYYTTLKITLILRFNVLCM